MELRRRKDHTLQAPEDHLDDLRAQLPTSFAKADDATVALLWAGLAAARHGHSAEWLIQQLGLPEHDARTIIDHCRHPASPD